MPRILTALTDRGKQLLGRALMPLFVIAIAGLMISILVVRDPTTRSRLQRAAILVSGAMLIVLVRRNSKLAAASLTSVRDGALAETVASIGTATHCAVDLLYVVEPCDRPQAASVTLYRRNVFISRRAVEELDESTLRYGIAFELSAKAVRVNALIGLGFVIGLAGTLWLINWLPTNGHTPAKTEPLLAAALVGVLLAGSVLGVWCSRADTVDQIRAALKIVPDPDAAREWFETSLELPDNACEEKKVLKQKAFALCELSKATK